MNNSHLSRIAAARKRDAIKSLRKAHMAQGTPPKASVGGISASPGGISASPAAYLSERRYIDDFQYVADDSLCLIKQAQARLMWGHSITQQPRSTPFIETVLLYESALNRAWEHRMDSRSYRVHLQQAQDALARKQKPAWIREKVRGWHKSVEVDALPTRSHRKRMKNRTREERIADLRAALGREDNDKAVA